MNQAYIEDIARFENQEVTIRGWLANRRSSGKLHFLQVRDGTGTIQCVIFKKEVSPEVFQLADHIPQESAVEVRGLVRADARAPIGFELGVTDLALVAQAEEFPITPKEHGIAFLQDYRHLWLRSSRPHAVMRVRAEVIRGIRTFLDERGFTLVDAPIFTPSACEGTTNLFETEYFGRKAYLTQSGQLYMEAAAMALGKVYCFGPTFRAEKSKTRRHLTEFWMVEPEVAFLDLEGAMDLAEELVVSLVGRVLEHRRRELATLERNLAPLEAVKKPLPRITYDQAVDLLNAQGKPMAHGEDFGGDEESVISQAFDRPVMVYHYPTACKAFYMKAHPQNPALSLSVDVLAPEGYGEIIGGGQRENDQGRLEGTIAAHGLPREAFEWYLDLRRYGSVPHSGFGLGVERFVAWLCGLDHVREAIPFPRMMERLTP